MASTMTRNKPVHRIGRFLKGLLLIAVWLVVLIFAALIGVRVFNWFNTGMTTTAAVNESAWVQLGGITQNLHIRGQDQRNPVVIFLHGGPGNPVGFINYVWQPQLEDEYTFIHWDQRGTGRTYYANPRIDPTTITVDQLLSDLDELVDYARKRFGQEKVFILGHSWGTVLGSRYTLEHPENVRAYISVGQIVDPSENPEIEAIRKLPDTDIFDIATLNTAVEKYQAAYDRGIFDSASFQTMDLMREKYLSCAGEIPGWKLLFQALTSPSLTLTDLRWYYETADFARLNEMQKSLIDYLYFDYNAFKDNMAYKVPVHFISGACDWVTPQAMVQAYEAKVTAPAKSFTLLPNTGHLIFLDDPAAFARVVWEKLNSVP